MNKKTNIFFSLIISIMFLCNMNAQTIEQLVKKANEHYSENNYSKAQEYYLEILKIVESENNISLIAKTSLDLAKCYYFLYDHKNSMKWAKNGLHYAEISQIDTLLSQSNYFIGALYIEDQNTDSAEKYSYKAIELLQKEKNFGRISQTYSTLAELHLNTTKDESKIEGMIKNAEKYAKLSNNKSMAAFVESKKYNYYFFLKKDYEKALKHINESEKLYSETNNREALLNAYRGKAECLIMLHDTTAKLYMNKWFKFKDSILQAEKSENIAKYETIYETEKTFQENKLLQEENKTNRLLIIVIITVSLFAIAIVLLLYNKNNLKKKERELILIQKLQNDKERIARDLHDNVGGQLSYIIYSLDGINEESATKRIELIASINKSVRSVIANLRETIWAISDANIKVQDFSDKFKVFARNLFKHTNTKILYSEEIKEDKQLNALLALNVYRICQEILTNAFKYAKANEVKINIQYDNKKLQITIHDDGIGFDDSANKKEQYGLKNIKKRAEEFSINISLKTEINKGTKYSLIVKE